jgi:hypothetical protein
MILHGFRAGSPVVTDPGCCPSAARGATLALTGPRLVVHRIWSLVVELVM